ncbi:hypothetical protein [Erythrobacter sp. THAF29]|nr:hypothetical protein [Erythrobacter sp. THAF29]QFT78439.1 hypothetical protein FIU90_12885 [Erythrobacter sp. THAF29]
MAEGKARALHESRKIWTRPELEELKQSLTDVELNLGPGTDGGTEASMMS